MRSLCSYGGEYPRESLSHDLIRSTDEEEVYKECSFPPSSGKLDRISSNYNLKRIYYTIQGSKQDGFLAMGLDSYQRPPGEGRDLYQGLLSI